MSKTKLKVGTFVDCRLLLTALLQGVARWEAFKSSPMQGEVCVSGLRYCTHLDVYGVPVLHNSLRQALQKVVVLPKNNSSFCTPPQ